MNETLDLKANGVLIVEGSDKVCQAGVLHCLPPEGCRALQMVALAPLRIRLHSRPPHLPLSLPPLHPDLPQTLQSRRR